MKKIMTVFGTRPEAIKMAPLVKALEYDAELEPMIVVTAQHREMLDSVLHTFNIKPHYDLNIMKEGQTLSDITSRAMTKLEDVIKKERPDMVLVHGDTTTTFSGALAAFYNKVAIGHVEAGLRTRHKYAPFPEEVNRQMVSNLADLHFAPTKGAANNLLQENKSPDSIIITGNTAIDTLELTIQKEYTSDIIRKHQGKRIILLTVHRRENVGQPMINIYKAMRKIVDEYEDIVIVSPLHLNPKVRELAYEYLGEHERIELIEPLDVVDFHNFANKAYLILTDSGGIQEEAPSLNKPVLVLRDVTERPEGVTAGTLKVVGTDFDNVFKSTTEILENQMIYDQMALTQNPYGDGNASLRICESIKYYFGLTSKMPKSFNS
ncbi:UDP-N-acetylglucosamine 2-epimerase [Staphylococcus haemolyticus]|jgi:UDP-N-acetylglucosamine 2-epimerase (non-hydrolysing)|uniref:non-hydrolyzing UDP-N-acetylglucosamine 2-epimerase n=1 Tax=Staphylococcus TaxID=1279 RepID=UPI00031F5E93|nr:MULTISPECIES: UDP-N-acetylglucosamine 2-epimerase (non-hydrolyzing) [Staphylococcus]MBC3014295.1 UDP-N-acetylglucosamine 2-epimerase (non-hydrolyzing) [Staphylococcus haemolyticus]MBC3103355.1 UDP-N-acetylglucosamine 2-epimerase (non-hydrolyzing) [Staphylococcus haemolyticus]MBC3105749.1 UDP-N-acetylglucosamine 2-epimerase (non-hydrolyzing) [Staphylococcus haemolyticus]MBC3115504.1 UDP-N-acetylglucosamine 2-epimerase (non-hydrolyzing) [Staphylococcus haemolyticus]MBC3124649.1 UDP-N-acetylgl